MFKEPDIFTIEVITTAEHFLALSNEWTDLVCSIPFYLFTESFEWNLAWFLANQEKILKIFILVFRDSDNKVVGIIPLYLGQMTIGLLHYKLLELFGGKDHGCTGIIARQEHRESVLRQAMKFITTKLKEYDILAFRRLDSREGSSSFIEKLSRRNNLPFNTESHLRVPYIRLGTDWQDYQSHLSKQFAREIRRKTRRLNEKGQVLYKVKEAPITEEDFRAHLMLEDRGWKGRAGSSVLKRPHLHRLLHHFVGKNSGPVSMQNFQLLLDDQSISSSLVFKTAHGLYICKITYDENHQACSPGLLLRLYEIEYACKHNLDIYDFAGFEKPWMRFFAEESHQVSDIYIYRRRLRNLLRYLAMTKCKQTLEHAPHLNSFVSRYVSL